MRRRRALVTLAALGAASAVASATPPPSRDARIRAEARDREARGEVCEAIEQLGSRLRGHMICMSKQEWAERRQQDRMLIDRSQMLGCVPGSPC